MKHIIYLLIVGITINAHAQVLPPKYDWNVTLKVVDETGRPVEGAKAHVYYLNTHEIAGLTDTDGTFTASHHDGSENLAFRVEKNGYYPFDISYHLGRDYKSENWNPTQTIILKKIIKPIPMDAKSVNLGMPVFDKPAGFDLEIGDWVGPYGKGITSDMIFTAHREKRAENDSVYQLTVSFPNIGDGIQEFTVPRYYLRSPGSGLRSAQDAPVNGYESKWIQIKTRRPDKPIESNWDENRNYYFRVRTKLDVNGNVVSTHYGKIYGNFLKFSYYLNPTPNDPNIEFDPKQNLMTNLKFGEGVSQP